MVAGQPRRGPVWGESEHAFEIAPGGGEVAHIAREESALEQGLGILRLTQQHPGKISRRAPHLPALAPGGGAQDQRLAAVRVAREQPRQVLDRLLQQPERGGGDGTVDQKVGIIRPGGEAARRRHLGAVGTIEREPKPGRVGKQRGARICWRFRMRPQRLQDLRRRLGLVELDQCHRLAVPRSISPALGLPSPRLRQRFAWDQHGDGKAAVVGEIRRRSGEGGDRGLGLRFGRKGGGCRQGVLAGARRGAGRGQPPQRGGAEGSEWQQTQNPANDVQGGDPRGKARGMLAQHGMERALVVFGLGYSGRAIADAAREAGWRVVAVSRSPCDGPRFAVVPFTDPTAAVADATHIVFTAAPAEAGDPVLAAHGQTLAEAPKLRWIGYLSTTGVYGDRGGAWVTETDEPAPAKPQSLARRAAEEAWEAFAARRRIALDLIRLGGIYGPGRSPFDDLRAGRARRIVKPDHAFNRIHVADIAGLVLAAAARPGEVGRARVLHGVDDEPALQAEVVAEAARLLGIAAPPEVPFAEAARTMGPMALGFWSENRRVANALTKSATGWAPRYPSYREGLAAILAEEKREGAGEEREVGRA